MDTQKGLIPMLREFGLAAMALGAAMIATPAHAAGTGINPGNPGGLVTDSGTLAPGIVYSGQCDYGFVAAGVNGGGATFVINGVGSAAGVDRGSPVIATGVRCRLYKDAVNHYAGPTFTPGTTSQASSTFTSNSVTGGTICVLVYADLRDGRRLSSVEF